jgi:hypothetical protein
MLDGLWTNRNTSSRVYLLARHLSSDAPHSAVTLEWFVLNLKRLAVRPGGTCALHQTCQLPKKLGSLQRNTEELRGLGEDNRISLPIVLFVSSTLVVAPLCGENEPHAEFIGVAAKRERRHCRERTVQQRVD